jgi:predicted nucleic-acid-binding protein
LGRQAVKITADTNVLVRAITADDPAQTISAQTALARADVVAIPETALCELVWVLSRGYKLPPGAIAEAIRRLIGSANVRVNKPAAEAGLAMLDSGGDFADGVIAHNGRWLGADVFVSFDRHAVTRLKTQGHAARLLG